LKSVDRIGSSKTTPMDMGIVSVLCYLSVKGMR
jgi:hypothetical protein